MQFTRLSTFALTVSATLGLAGCGGSSGGGGGGDPGPGGGSVSCNGSVDISGGGGLAGDADYQGLHYFVAGDRLCALDTGSGTAFEVDRGVDPGEGVMTAVLSGDIGGSGGIIGGLGVAGLVYVAGDEIRYASTDGTAAAPPTPRRVSSETAAGDIAAFQIAYNYDQTNDTVLAYGKGEFNDLAWYQVRLSDGPQLPPREFPAGQRPLAQVLDFGSGDHGGWLVHDAQSDELLRVDIELQQPGAVLLEGVSETNTVANFNDGSVLLSARTATQGYQFVFYSADEDSADAVAPAPPGFSSLVIPTTSDGEAVYYLVDSGDDAELFRVDAEGHQSLDRVTDASGTFVINAGDRIVWGWNRDGASGVRAVDKAGDSAGTLHGSDRVVSTTVLGSGNGWVFFNESDLDALDQGQLVIDALAVRADGTGSPVIHDGAMWAGAANPATVAYEANLPTQPVSEVFLVRDDSNPMAGLQPNQHLYAVNAANPAEEVDLGALEQATFGPSVLMQSFGLGPHRLMVSANDLLYANTRQPGSAQTLLQGSMEQGLMYFTLEGF